MTESAGSAETGRTPRIKEVQAVALYDAKGKIHHMHHVVVLEGGRSVDRDSMMQEAKAHAKMMGRAVEKLKALYVPQVANPMKMHRVDVKKQALVEIEPPTPAVSRGKRKKR